MKTKRIIAIVAAAACLCILGTEESFAQKKDKNKEQTAPENAIVPQVNPLVIEIESFEGRALTGDRSYITILGDKVQGRITSTTGMSRSPRFSGRDALVFNKCDARIGEPRVNKKGTNYSFDVRVEDALFFNANSNTDWRLYITVYNDGRVTVDISSDSIALAYSQRDWMFYGHIDGEKTLKLQQVVEMEPSLMMPVDDED